MSDADELDLLEFDLAIVESHKQRRVMAPVRWYGGKGNLAKKIIPHIPAGKVYVEPYCGAASIFWHLDPRPVEVLNDLNGEVINLWRVLQDADKFRQLAHRLVWTPYSLDEFRKARRNESADDIDRAWAFFVRQNQGFSGESKSDGQWSRSFVTRRAMALQTAKWLSRLASLRTWHDRLQRVQLDSRCALDVIRYWDSPETVFYFDPPYILGTRAKGSRDVYHTEQPDEHHRELVQVLLGIQGQAVLSGYDHEIYQPLTDAGWRVEKFETACHAAGKVRGSQLKGAGSALKHAARTEVLWIKSNSHGGELFK